jgi:hypothetical protein
MEELGPAEFSAATGLSVKAPRLYDERGLLEPARVIRPLATAVTQQTRSPLRAVSRLCERMTNRYRRQQAER